ncbi:Sec-independent protein translocase subunit TatA [Streptomyces avidinii]|uniref:Sec-independent protein translocase subunit TatA n=1 Tax=Streptomyces TaxID=1883 RepID=UPI000F3A8EF6|nr:Sec-independent protein translocase subunit TatA [Streptomyces sp. ADI95-16]AYV26425.1 twin arginine translocase protein A [Streptomyces sp. ADI95-16]
MFGISEIAIILIIVVLVFGAKKLPELARSMGKSARILKSEARAMKHDGDSSSTPDERPPTDSPRIVEGTVVDTPSPHPAAQPTAETRRP